MGDGLIDLKRIRLTPDMLAKLKPFKRQRRFRGTYFLKGPISWPWLVQAAKQPGSAFKLAIKIWFLVGMRRSRTVKVSLSRIKDLGVSPPSGSRALRALEEAGLLQVERKPGCAPLVTVINFSGPSD